MLIILQAFKLIVKTPRRSEFYLSTFSPLKNICQTADKKSVNLKILLQEIDEIQSKHRSDMCK